jgi:hypothetical protein
VKKMRKYNLKKNRLTRFNKRDVFMRKEFTCV